MRCWRSGKETSRGGRMLLAPFRPGAPHIVALRAIFPDFPERAQRIRHLTDLESETRNEKRKSPHGWLRDLRVRANHAQNAHRNSRPATDRRHSQSINTGCDSDSPPGAFIP